MARCEPAVAAMPWFVPAAAALWLKFRIVNSDAVRESALGIRVSGFLTVWERLALLRGDVAVGFLLVPLLLLAISFPLPRPWRAALSSAVAALAGAVLVVEETARQASGGFISFRLLGRAAEWVIRSKDPSLLYMPITNRVALLALTAVILVCGVAVTKASSRLLRRCDVIAVSVMILAAAVTLAMSTIKAPQVSWTQPLLVTAGKAAIGQPEFKPAAPATPAEPSLVELRRRYRDLAHVPEPQSSPWAGKAQGYNVLFFIMETAPAQVFDPARDDLGDMPNARRLRQNSFVASAHYSTIPLSSSALFSMFASSYARGSEAVGASIADDVKLPGVIHVLADAGYETAYYGFVWRAHRERDDRMFASLGFRRINEASIEPGEDQEGKSTFKGPIEYVKNHDRELLEKLKQDMRNWTASRQKFVAVYFPQLGHDPWRVPTGRHPNTLMERGRALAAVQDAWLGELLAELERDGAIDRTIIVLTSDHGLRSTLDAEQKFLRMATTRGDDIMIRVPLLISVPGMLTKPERIVWPTSHIDVSPTLLDLLGIAHDAEQEQGVDIWNAGLEHRRLFLAMDFFGVQTGFSEGGSYYMRSRSQTVFKSTRAHFEDGDALLHDSEESKHVRRILDEYDSLQQGILAQIFRGESERQNATPTQPAPPPVQRAN